MRLQQKDWVVVLAPTFSPYHVQGFNPDSLHRLLNALDFEVKDFRMFGEISPQTDEQTARKKIEYNIGKFVNWIGNSTGRGMYMEVWAKREAVKFRKPWLNKMLGLLVVK